MTKIKVIHGTRSDKAPRLCDTCWNGLIVRGAADSDEQVFCNSLDAPVKLSMRVVECSRFNDKSQPSLYDLRKIAWVLDVDPERQPIGFLRAAEWLEKYGDED